MRPEALRNNRRLLRGVRFRPNLHWNGRYKKIQTLKQEQIGQPKRLSYKIREAAQLVGVSEISIRRAIEKGQLRACRAFRHLLIPASELEKLIGGSEAK